MNKTNDPCEGCQSSMNVWLHLQVIKAEDYYPCGRCTRNFTYKDKYEAKDEPITIMIPKEYLDFEEKTDG